MTDNKRRVAIIGGGITGLAAAYHLQQQVERQGLQIEIVIIEASHRFGGYIQTVNENGYQIEKGPDSFTDHKGTIAQLASELGLAEQLVKSRDDRKYVAVNEDLYAVPKGVQFGIPTEITPFMTSDLVSWSGKARATLDFLLPQGKLEGDQSLGIWMRKRLGGEVVENIAEPLLSGIYNGDIDQLSLEAVLPFLPEYKTNSKGLMSSVRAYTRAPDFVNNYLQSFSFLGGLSTLVDALIQQLSDIKLKNGVRVSSIKKMDNQLMLSLNNQSSIKVDGVMIAASHKIAETFFLEKEIFEDLQSMPLNTVATISMIFDVNQISPDFKGTDFYISRNSDVSITSATFMSRKWEHITPKDKELIKVYIGRTGDEAIVELSDRDIEKVVLQDLHKLIGLKGMPEKVIISRHKKSMPQYIVGHTKSVENVKRKLHEHYPTIRLAGNSYDGISLPKCIAQAQISAEELLKEME